MLVLILGNLFGAAFFMKSSFGAGDGNIISNKILGDEKSKLTVRDKLVNPNAADGKNPESQGQAIETFQGKWNSSDTSEWSKFASIDGNETRLIVGVHGEESASLVELNETASKYQAKIVNEVSFGFKAGAIIVKVPSTSVTALLGDLRVIKSISYVEPDMKVQADAVPNDPYWSMQWGPKEINADWAWNTTAGSSSVLVAVVDTGIDYNHPDLAANYVPFGFNWVNMNADPRDDFGHGTHVAGIIAGTLNNHVGIAGLAQVRVMAEKVLDQGGGGYWDWIANGIVHAANQGANIISMSFGGYGYSQLLHEAVKYAYDKGVLLIASAGNGYTDAKTYPAAFDEVIAVAATDPNDNKAGFSNFGDWIELAAPGVSILSTMPTYPVTLNYEGYSMNYDYLSGTSMACPHVAGLAALVWSEFPGKARDWVRLRLRSAADDLGDPGFDEYFGYGRVNARKAMEQTIQTHDLIAFELTTPLYVEPDVPETVNATIINFGGANENNVAVRLWANGTLASSAVIGFLGSGSSTTVHLPWNPAIVGLYNVTVYVVPVLGETNAGNNALSKYIYFGFPTKAVVLRSAGSIYSQIITNWQILGSEWYRFGNKAVSIDYETLNKADITYEDIKATKADVLIISCAYDPYSGWEFADSEIQAIRRYVYEGHGLIATAGTFYEAVPNNNKLAPLFGLNQTTQWTATSTSLLDLLNTTHPMFTSVSNPLVIPTVGTALPYDGRWDSDDLVDGEYLALGHYQESAIVTFRGLVYISAWPEVTPPYYNTHLQLLYNAITWSHYQAPQHELTVSLEAPAYLELGNSTSLDATVQNVGLNSETGAELHLFINGESVSFASVPELLVGESYTTSFPWTATDVGNYNVTAYSSPVTGEEYLRNNIVTKEVNVFRYERSYAAHRWVGGGSPMGWHGNDFSWEYTLPFAFPFYTVNYRSIYISSNGLITFDSPDSSTPYYNGTYELANKLAIAPAWYDWAVAGQNDIYIWENLTHVSIHWYVTTYGSSTYADFEAILSSNGEIQFNYGSSNDTLSSQATAGISNGAGHIISESFSNLNYINTIMFTPNQSSAYLEAAYNKLQSGSPWLRVSDSTSWSGTVMEAPSFSTNGGWLYGPYITSDWYGASMLGKPYVATFRLKVSSNVSANPVVYVDVTYNAGTVLQSRSIRASDFAQSDAWQNFQLTFFVPRSLTYGLEFRVQNWNNGVTDAYVDRISVSHGWNASTVYSEASYDKPQSGGSWFMVSDSSSWSGLVMKASASSANGATLFGPYISTGWDGQSMLGRPYSVTFRLKVSSNASANFISYVDVGYNAGYVLQSMLIRASDFASSNVWQDFKLTFIVPISLTAGLEFRVSNWNNGVTDLFVGKITVCRDWDAYAVYCEGGYNKLQFGSSWSRTSDTSSYSGLVLQASTSSTNGGWLYGPYITSDWYGASMLGKPYVATFRLKVSSNVAADSVAYIDVGYNAGFNLQSRMIRANDFASSNVWQDFNLTFIVPSSLMYGLEFRIQNWNNGIADVFVDKITVRQVRATSTPNPWSMFRHDASHTGYSLSSAPNTNSSLWAFQTGGGIVSSPAVADGKVFVGGTDNFVYAFDQSGGTLIWSSQLSEHIWGSPSVAYGKVFIADASSVYALDENTGAQMWRDYVSYEGLLYSSPVVKDGMIFIGSDGYGILALNQHNGLLVWNIGGIKVTSTPAIADGMIFLASYAINPKVYAFNEYTGILIWSVDVGGISVGSFFSSPAVSDGKVFVGLAYGQASWSGTILALNEYTGTIVWAHELPDSVFSSPAVAYGKVFIGCYDHKLYAFDEANGNPIWSYSTGNSIETSSPAVADGKVFVGSDDHNVYALDATTGAKVWSYVTGHWVWSSPAIANGVVYVGSMDGRLYAIGTPTSLN
jgi:subtilisin family serine protease/outer membrane protein assembly factor BamB